MIPLESVVISAADAREKIARDETYHELTEAGYKTKQPDPFESGCSNSHIVSA